MGAIASAPGAAGRYQFKTDGFYFPSRFYNSGIFPNPKFSRALRMPVIRGIKIQRPLVNRPTPYFDSRVLRSVRFGNLTCFIPAAGGENFAVLEFLNLLIKSQKDTFPCKITRNAVTFQLDSKTLQFFLDINFH